MSEIIDAYAHVGLPRFQTAAGYWRRATPVGVAQAVFSAFDASPALAYLHGLVERDPDRVRALGIPIGEGSDRAESVRAQLAAGFSGIRLADRDVVPPDDGALEAIGDAGGIAVVCGASISSHETASKLLGFLERHQQAIVVGGHFAGPRDPQALASGATRELFRHPRFAAVFSRHGAFSPDLLEAWATEVLTLTGWSRVMWGSESPVLHWRNETLTSALAWVERLGPSPHEREAFFAGTARRIFFQAQPALNPLELAVDPWRTAPAQPATLWSNGLPVRQDLAGRLMRSWHESATPSATLGEHLERVLDEALPPLADSSKRSVDTRRQTN